LLEYAPRFSEGSLCVGCIFIVIVLTLSALISQTWIAFAAISLLLVGSIVGERWRYLLVVVALASWLAMHLLNYVSDIAYWFVDLFKVSWLALFLLALAALFRRRWRELAISGLTLSVTFVAFVGVLLGPEEAGVLPNRWLQETGFRVYASHLIRTTPLEEFLSRCKLVDYVEENGARQQVGGCYDGLRSTVWFRIIVIYDPSGQIAWPAIQRTLAWRLAVLHLPDGRPFVHDDDVRHLVGNFYWFLDSSPDPGDDGKVRPD
jgi:hypothetical protein